MEAAIKDLQNVNSTNIWYPEYTYHDINSNKIMNKDKWPISIIANAQTKMCRLTIKVTEQCATVSRIPEGNTSVSLFTIAGTCNPVWPKVQFPSIAPSSIKNRKYKWMGF